MRSTVRLQSVGVYGRRFCRRAFERWKEQGAWSLHLLEQEVIVREVYAERRYFTLEWNDESEYEDDESD